MFAGVAGAAAAVLALLPLTGMPKTVWLGELFLVPAALAALMVIRAPTAISRIIPAQVLALAAFITLSLGSGIGILLR